MRRDVEIIIVVVVVVVSCVIRILFKPPSNSTLARAGDGVRKVKRSTAITKPHVSNTVTFQLGVRLMTEVHGATTTTKTKPITSSSRMRITTAFSTCAPIRTSSASNMAASILTRRCERRAAVPRRRRRNFYETPGDAVTMAGDSVTGGDANEAGGRSGVIRGEMKGRTIFDKGEGLEAIANVPNNTSNGYTFLNHKRPSRAATIVCVGDIHGQWNEGDEMALRSMQPDLVLFVGDYGNEDLVVTSRIAAFASEVPFGVATVFGNHDAHYTVSERKRQYAPYDVGSVCRVSRQMELLAPYDVSYRSASFAALGVSVCGGRAFSFGGPNWKYTSFFRRYVGVQDMNGSSRKLVQAVTQADHGVVVFVSHSGPRGLGGEPSDPCGKDWGTSPGGDYGDADLRCAIDAARRQGKRVPLVLFGHMHHVLQDGVGRRVMLKTERDGEGEGVTVMLNAAVVPRHREERRYKPRLFHFQVVRLLEGGDVGTVDETWVSRMGEVHERTRLFDREDETTYNDVGGGKATSKSGRRGQEENIYVGG